jgi:hypothetical protein
MSAPAPARRLRPGDPAPAPEVLGRHGPVLLATAWAEGPVVLTFLRHFG